jgi:hypothetical protein
MPESPETTLQEQRKQQKQQRRREKRDRKKLRKQKERQQQQHGTVAPPVISLPPIQPQLYPPPGPKEDWTQQQDMEWQYQLYIHNQQETQQQQQDQDQHRQWQEYYRQLQLLYWYRQEAQRFAGLPPFCRSCTSVVCHHCAWTTSRAADTAVWLYHRCCRLACTHRGRVCQNAP